MGELVWSCKLHYTWHPNLEDRIPKLALGLIVQVHQVQNSSLITLVQYCIHAQIQRTSLCQSRFFKKKHAFRTADFSAILRTVSFKSSTVPCYVAWEGLLFWLGIAKMRMELTTQFLNLGFHMLDLGVTSCILVAVKNTYNCLLPARRISCEMY